MGQRDECLLCGHAPHEPGVVCGMRKYFTKESCVCRAVWRIEGAE